MSLESYNVVPKRSYRRKARAMRREAARPRATERTATPAPVRPAAPGWCRAGERSTICVAAQQRPTSGRVGATAQGCAGRCRSRVAPGTTRQTGESSGDSRPCAIRRGLENRRTGRTASAPSRAGGGFRCVGRKRRASSGRVCLRPWDLVRRSGN